MMCQSLHDVPVRAISVCVVNQNIISSDKLLVEPISKDATMMPSPHDLRYKIILKVNNSQLSGHLYMNLVTFSHQNTVLLNICLVGVLFESLKDYHKT